MNTIRSIIFIIGYSLLTIIYGSLSLLSWLLPPLVRHRFISYWTYISLIWLRITCGIRHEVSGKENFDKALGPYVVLSKHQSTWETLFLQGQFWPASTVLKKELLQIPFFGWGLRALKPIAIDRGNPKEALKQVKEKGQTRLNEGLNIVLFPEGTRTLPGERKKYARSGADIAKKASAPILPVAHNAGKYWPNKSFLKFPGTIKVVIGKPIMTEGKSSKEIIQEVELWIESTTAKLS